MSYLSNYDVLRNIAGVSKKFYELSQDQHLIRKIEVDSETWTKIKEGKYYEKFFRVLKRSVKLTFLSLDFGIQEGEKFFEALPMMNHEFLREFCLISDGRKDFEPLDSAQKEDEDGQDTMCDFHNFGLTFMGQCTVY